MGSAEGGASSAKDALDAARGTVLESVGSARETVSEVPEQMRSTTRGNPLAVGLGAFAIGGAIGSLIPVSNTERQAA